MLQGLEMDGRKMDFEDCSFDVAIDKGTFGVFSDFGNMLLNSLTAISGTVDALLCEQTSAWEVEPELEENIDKMLSEVSRYFCHA